MCRLRRSRLTASTCLAYLLSPNSKPNLNPDFNPDPLPVGALLQVLRPDGSEATLPQTDGSVAASLVCIAFRAGAEVSLHPRDAGYQRTARGPDPDPDTDSLLSTKLTRPECRPESAVSLPARGSSICSADPGARLPDVCRT